MGQRRIVIDSDDDVDDFPSLRPTSRTSTLPPAASSKYTNTAKLRLQSPVQTPRSSSSGQEPGALTTGPKTAMRRRKLGSINHDTSLLRPQGASRHAAGRTKPNGFEQPEIDLPQSSPREPFRPKPRVELRTRRTRRISEAPTDSGGELSTEEATVLEDVEFDEDFDRPSERHSPPTLKIDSKSTVKRVDQDVSGQNADVESDGQVRRGGEKHAGLDDRGHHSSGDEEAAQADDTQFDTDKDSVSNSATDTSEYQDSSVCSNSSSNSLGDVFSRSPTRRHAATKLHMPKVQAPKAQAQKKGAAPRVQTAMDAFTDEGSSLFFSAEESFSEARPELPPQSILNRPNADPTAQRSAGGPRLPAAKTRTKTPPPGQVNNTRPERLQSPSKKLPRIPKTPHQPNTDDFWSQMVVDDWNMEHSPRKLLFDPDNAKRDKITRRAAGNPAPALPILPSPGKGTTTVARAKDAKKKFQKAKHDMAEKFLAELDSIITDGQLSRLAAATGGVKIEWTNKLNTTAGRANWRRETLRPKKTAQVISIEDGSVASESPADTTTRVKHHASIELAEKVIDDEHRLLNVIAHEFCHLANFMVSGITGNPHGKEFKSWAAKCSQHFGDRGIQVTTKHAYEIDFKYVWTCEVCATEFKRHSKSIDPVRHRCGACKGVLKQTKPVPRGTGSKGASKVDADGNAVTTGPSEYQKFMKEHMAVVRRENPNSPQKVIMTLVADKWSKAKALRVASDSRPAAEARGHEEGTSSDSPEACVDHLGRALVDLTLS